MLEQESGKLKIFREHTGWPQAYAMCVAAMQLPTIAFSASIHGSKYIPRSPAGAVGPEVQGSHLFSLCYLGKLCRCLTFKGDVRSQWAFENLGLSHCSFVPRFPQQRHCEGECAYTKEEQGGLICVCTYPHQDTCILGSLGFIAALRRVHLSRAMRVPWRRVWYLAFLSWSSAAHPDVSTVSPC